MLRDAPGSHFPGLDGLVPAGGVDHVAAGGERHRGHVVVVAVHRLHALERLVEVPQLDRHVRAARH